MAQILLTPLTKEELVSLEWVSLPSLRSQNLSSGIKLFYGEPVMRLNCQKVPRGRWAEVCPPDFSSEEFLELA